MKKCLKITFSGKCTPNFLESFIQKHAKNLLLEGTAQAIEDDQFKVIVCGESEALDSFVDALHKGSASISLENIEVEPFLTTKDYRGVFRLIE
jgi:acylphosphatase